MPRSIALATILCLAGVALVGVSAAAEPQRPGDDSANVFLRVTVVDTNVEGVESRHSVSALALDGRSARMVTGWRLPIPETTVGPATEGSPPVTTYSYQDVGLSATLQGRVVSANRLRVTGRIEVSAVDEEASAGRPAPSLGTFRHDFEVALVDGVGEAIAEVTKPRGGSLSLAVSASIRD